jgi:hypothetical protein
MGVDELVIFDPESWRSSDRVRWQVYRRQGEDLVIASRHDGDAVESAALARERVDHALDDRWTLAHASDDGIRALAGGLGVKYKGTADGEFNHSAVIVLLDQGATGASSKVNGNAVIALTDRRLAVRKLVGAGFDLPSARITGVHEASSFRSQWRGGRVFLVIATDTEEIGFIVNDHMAWMREIADLVDRRA